LGELRHKGQRVQDQTQYLYHKRLIDAEQKLHKRLPRSTFLRLPVPDRIAQTMRYKTVSGNQGIFHYDVVQDLLQSVDVMQLFALTKYACCCCVEERNWIAALDMIGYGEDALQQASMFQVWGGELECGSSMNNAVLSRNESLCYRNEYVDEDSLYFRGNQTWEYLQDARDRGMLFAHKFRSDDKGSMELLEMIRTEIWGEF
jgi:hypothetical protein